MSAILKFDFPKREQLRFSEVNYLNHTKTTQFCMWQLHFPWNKGKTRTSHGPIPQPLTLTLKKKKWFFVYFFFFFWNRSAVISVMMPSSANYTSLAQHQSLLAQRWVNLKTVCQWSKKSTHTCVLLFSMFESILPALWLFFWQLNKSNNWPDRIEPHGYSDFMNARHFIPCTFIPVYFHTHFTSIVSSFL